MSQTQFNDFIQTLNIDVCPLNNTNNEVKYSDDYDDDDDDGDGDDDNDDDDDL